MTIFACTLDAQAFYFFLSFFVEFWEAQTSVEYDSLLFFAESDTSVFAESRFFLPFSCVGVYGPAREDLNIS